MSKLEPPQPAQPPLEELIHSAVDLARVCMRMDVAFVSEFKDGRRVFRHVVAPDGEAPVKPGDSDPLDESYCQHVVDGTIPAIVDDSHVYPFLKRLPATEAMRIRAYLGVPMWLSDGSVYGTFCCYSRMPSFTLTDADVQAMTRFAELIARLLENRVLAERAIASSRERLGSVIDGRLLGIVYQPIVDLADGSLLGVEALARFPTEPERGPDLWFEEAHRVARGAELELLAIELAGARLAMLPPHAYLALNVSPATILCGSLAARLAGVPLARVVLEITEHAPIGEYAALADALAPLRAAGLRLAIDDAGSGYASFRHILQLQPDIIKLDRSLIRDIDSDAGRRALAAALTGFAKATACRVVAEGIETPAELATLRALGVDAGQGWLLGRPAAIG
ncbi:EAL domain-containing protein [uncultured Massilia sp.]|uniref:sensor domain-containing phosphodiesterase n=1 Tax=uncultured Massilia sp. TaxID=169973 RepID=UPI002582FC94|nr:EAL domain-containing protein [uncultured Massilia sp.]